LNVPSPHDQRQVYIEAATEDWLGQVATGGHVPDSRVRAGRVWTGRCSPPVAGGGLRRWLVVVKGRCGIADDAATRHAGHRATVPIVKHTAAIGGRVVQEAAARHHRGAGCVVEDAAAVVGGLVARARPTDGAAVLDIQHGLVVDPASVIGGQVITDSTTIHCRGDGRVEDPTTVLDSRIPRAGSTDGAAVLDIQRGLVVDPTAIDAGRVVPDGAVIHRRRADCIVYTGAAGSCQVACDGPADCGSVLDDQRSRVVNTTTVAGSIGADRAAIHRRSAI